MNDLETLAARARIAKKRLLKHGAPGIKVTVIYDGCSPVDEREMGMALRVEMTAGVGVAALEALADELDRKMAEGTETTIPQENMVSA